MSNKPVIVDCSTDMADVQSMQDKRGIEIDTVGVRRLFYPLVWHDGSGTSQSCRGEFSLSVSLPAQQRGTHMSRFLEHLHTAHRHISLQSWVDFAPKLANALQAQSVSAQVRFSLFRPVFAPITQQQGMQEIHIELKSAIKNGIQQALFLSITLPAATVCPCSKQISDRGAHNQRGEIQVSGYLSKVHLDPICLFDLVQEFEKCASVPVYPLLKRQDEKYVTEAGYDNAKFVEDVARDVVLATRTMNLFERFTVTVENQESIHAHNAFAKIKEGKCE